MLTSLNYIFVCYGDKGILVTLPQGIIIKVLALKLHWMFRYLRPYVSLMSFFESEMLGSHFGTIA